MDDPLIKWATELMLEKGSQLAPRGVCLFFGTFTHLFHGKKLYVISCSTQKYGKCDNFM